MTEAKSNEPGETVSHYLNRIVREPIRVANQEFIVKKNPITGEEETFRSIDTMEGTKGDVEITILENMHRRKKNILKREGD